MLVNSGLAGSLDLGCRRPELAVSFLDKWRRVTGRAPCPVCGKPDWCLVARDESRAVCMRAESPLPRRGGGWLHALRPGQISQKQASRRTLAPSAGYALPKKAAPPEILDRVYRGLLNHLTLSEAHAAQLRERGMSDTEIASGGYRTFPRRGRVDVARALAQRFTPAVVTKVPGFYIEDNGRSTYLAIAGSAGLLIPCHDVEGRITGLQIRPDGASSGRKRAKYLPLTSYTENKPRRGGTPITVAHIRHVAIPPEITDSAIYITEGTIKANIASDRLGAVVISSPGVASFGAAGVVDVAVKLAKPGGRVVVAYDADKRGKPAVAQAETSLCRALLDAGLDVKIARWDPGLGKGLDDLLVADGTFSLTDLEDWDTCTSLPARVIEVDLPQEEGGAHREDEEFCEEDLYTVEDVRAMIYATAVQLLEEGAPGLHLFTSPPGSGKTTCILKALVDRHLAGGLLDWRDGTPVHRRMLFLTDTKEAISDALEASPELGEIAAFREGRSDNPKSPWYCARKAEIDELAQARHNAARELCWTCFETHSECSYMKAKREAEKRHVILAPKAVAFRDPSFLDGSGDLSPFSALIVDESLSPHLIEDVTITRNHLNTIEEGMDRCGVGEGHAFRLLVRLLQQAIATGERPRSRPCWMPLVPLLRELAAQQGTELEEVIHEAHRLVESHQPTAHLGFEETFYRQGKRIIPLCFLQDLVTRLWTEQQRPDGADTALWLEFAYQGSASHAHLIMKQERVIEALSSTLVIHSDAHPDKHALSLLFPHFEEHTWPARQHVHVTQFHNSTYSKTVLMAHRSCREDVEQLTRFYQLIEDRVLVITHKSLLTEDARARGQMDEAPVGWWGKHHKSLNRFSAIDALVIASYFCENIGSLRARIHALRDAAEPISERAVPNDEETSSQGEYRIYEGYRDERGRGRARLIPLDLDPDVQAAIESSWSSAVHQAIGRGRPILRDELTALRVFILPAIPVADLHVDDLQSTAAILGKDHPVEELNKGKQDEAASRVRVAIEALQSEGKRVTVNGVYTRFGGRWSTIKREVEHWENEQKR